MSDVHTTVARKLRSAAAALRADAAASNFVNLREALLTEIVELEKRADTLEEQAKPDEPVEFGSVVRAFVCGGIVEPWVRTVDREFSGWTNVHGLLVDWHKLCEPKVLRVGVGDNDAAYNKGVSDTVSALVDRLLEKRAAASTADLHLAYGAAIRAVEAL